MTATLLARARAAGLVLRAEDGRLVVSGPKPSDDLLAALRAGKADLLALLGAPANDRDPPPPETVPTDPAELLRHLRHDLGCRVRVDGDMVRIGPPHRCPPPVLAAAQAVAGDLRAIVEAETEATTTHDWRGPLTRPPSWSDPAAHPPAGCVCHCCQGQRWWIERVAPTGWRCWTCHPPDGAGPGEMEEVRT